MERLDLDAIARRYEAWPDKGAVVDGARLTVLAEPLSVQPGEQVEVFHVAERTQPGEALYVMGPKKVHGEYVDGELATDAQPEGEHPLVPLLYDGATRPSPGIDANYEVTRYRWDEPGRHEIQWRPGELASNVLAVDVLSR